MSGRRGVCAHGVAAPLSLCPHQLQEELDTRVQAWEQEHERTFLVKGQQFMEYVRGQWELFHQEKEKEKQERVSAELSALSRGPWWPHAGQGAAAAPALSCPSAWTRLHVLSPLMAGLVPAAVRACVC